MRANSLALRLFLSATAWTVVILVATGAILSSIYRDDVERSFDRRLGVYLQSLVADAAAPEQVADHGPPMLGEPLFELPLSGWYWQVTSLGAPKPDMRSSRSLWDGRLPRLAGETAATLDDDTRRGYVIGPEEQRLRMLERTVDLGEDGRYLIAVAGDSQEIDDEIAFVRPCLDPDLRHAGRRAAPHHHVPGPVRPGAAQAHFGIACRHQGRHCRAS